MAKCYTQWTVLDHKPIEKLERNLWTVLGTMADKRTRRVMSVARRTDGRLVIHNAIALEEPHMNEIEAWGEPAFLVVPNAHHRMDARIFKDRYPRIVVTAPRGIRRAVSAVVPFEIGYDEVPPDAEVNVRMFDGMGDREGFLDVTSDGRRSIAATDVLCNLPQLSGFGAWFASPSGCLSVPRFARWWLMKDREPLRAHLLRLADDPGLTRIIVAHGRRVDDDAAAKLRAAAERL